MTDPAAGTVDPPQFIVYAEPALLQQVIGEVDLDPAVKVLSVGGPAGAPERFVAQMAETRAEELRQRYGGQVTVEQDQPLMPYS